MPLSGSLVAQQIQRAYQAAEHQLAATRASIADADRSLDGLAEERDQALGDLAEFYLPSLDRRSLPSLPGEARQVVDEVLLRRDDEVARLRAQQQFEEERRGRLEEDLQRAHAALETLEDQQQQLAEQLASELAADPAFRQLSDRAAEAEAALERAEASLAEIEQELAEKLPAYQRSRLFMYLWNRGLGTPAYEARGWTRRMDRWVARLIDYPKARAGYEYLTQVPDQVRHLVDQDRQALSAIMDTLEQRRDEGAERIGLSRVSEQVEAAQDEHQRLLSELAGVEAALTTTRQSSIEAEDPRGKFYEEAIDQIRELLRRMRHDELERRVQETADPRDDQIVARLRYLDDQSARARTEATARRQQTEWLNRHLSDIAKLQQRFRAAGFDSARSQFDDSVDLVQELERVREGHDSIDSVWANMRRRQSFAPTRLHDAGHHSAQSSGNPLTQALVFAMTHAASSSMVDHARRAGQRRVQSQVTPSAPRRIAAPVRPPSPPPARRNPGGFHTRNKV